MRHGVHFRAEIDIARSVRIIPLASGLIRSSKNYCRYPILWQRLPYRVNCSRWPGSIKKPSTVLLRCLYLERLRSLRSPGMNLKHLGAEIGMIMVLAFPELVKEEAGLVQELSRSGDVNRSEFSHSRRAGFR